LTESRSNGPLLGDVPSTLCSSLDHLAQELVTSQTGLAHGHRPRVTPVAFGPDLPELVPPARRVDADPRIVAASLVRRSSFRVGCSRPFSSLESHWQPSPKSRYRYTCYMSSQPIRIGRETLQTLRERGRGSGEPLSRLAERYIEEGLRADRHPGVFFRAGPAGRRAVVVGGPDVWEIVSATRRAPEKGEALVQALAKRLGISESKVSAATRYYGEYPQEIDDWIAANEAEAERLRAALARERELLA